MLNPYTIIIEKANRNYSAYSPDLPGCVATGRNRLEVTRNMQEAIEFHIKGMIEEEVPIPAPRTSAGYVSVPER
jgi:predicted RNase H-like HicB family nuclease